VRAGPAGGLGVTWAVSLIARERVIGYRRTRGLAMTRAQASVIHNYARLTFKNC
jgi:hypothetical protein